MARVLQGLVLAAALAAIQTRAQPRIKFDHAQHAKLGDIGAVLKAARKAGTHLRPDATSPGSNCEGCHSGVRENVKRVSMSVMADCLVCHTKIDPPFSCSFCHTQPAVELKPVSHTKDFLDRHTSGLAKLNLMKTGCAVCHGRKFTCLGCH